tara:strand:+ start:1326 stop:1583 length:258 start_codon:yes stop_codon:yes gene_type:complete
LIEYDASSTVNRTHASSSSSSSSLVRSATRSTSITKTADVSLKAPVLARKLWTSEPTDFNSLSTSPSLATVVRGEKKIRFFDALT